MQFKTFETILEVKETNPFGFEGENFFISGEVLNPADGSSKWLVHNVAFNGMNLGGGLTTNLLTIEEIQENFSPIEENFDELEQLFIDDYNKPREEIPITEEPIFSEEELERIRKDFADFKFDRKPEFKPEVELRLWSTMLTPKEEDSFIKNGQKYVISAFARSSTSKELEYIVTEVVENNSEGTLNQYEVTELSLSYSSKEILLDKFTVIQ